MSVAEKQRDWVEGVDFLQKEFVPNRAETVEGVLGGIGWGGGIRCGGFVFTAHRFTQLFSRRQICDNVTQVMVDHLQDQLEKASKKLSKHTTTPSRFYMSLEVFANRGRDKKDHIRCQIWLSRIP